MMRGDDDATDGSHQTGVTLSFRHPHQSYYHQQYSLLMEEAIMVIQLVSSIIVSGKLSLSPPPRKNRQKYRGIYIHG